MGELYTYNATHLTIVREGTAEFTQMAQFGQVGSGRFALDDEAGTKAIVGHKDFSYTESSCSVPLTFRGFISDTEYGRDSGVERQPHVGASRGIGVSVVDVNAMLGFRFCYKQSGMTNAQAGKRPAETVAARLTWLLASPFVAFADNGRVTSVTTKTMGAADYRYQFPGDVLADCALAAGGFNYHVNDWGAGPELTFRDDNVSTADSSTLRISNVYADTSSVTLHPFKDATLSRRSDRVKSKLAYNYAKGTIVRERAATATTFNGERGGTASNSNVKSSAKATDDADEMLWQLHTEEDVIECTLLVTSAQVNLIRPGQRIEAKFSHLSQEGYSSFTWFRIIERTVTPIVADAGLYHLRVKLSPQEVSFALCSTLTRTAEATYAPLGGPGDLGGDHSNVSDNVSFYQKPGVSEPVYPTYIGTEGRWNFPDFGGDGTGAPDYWGRETTVTVSKLEGYNSSTGAAYTVVTTGAPGSTFVVDIDPPATSDAGCVSWIKLTQVGEGNVLYLCVIGKGTATIASTFDAGLGPSGRLGWSGMTWERTL